MFDLDIETDGFDEFQNDLDNLQETIQRLDGTNEVTFAELFPESFMTKHTEFHSFEELLEESDWEVDSQEDFEEIPEEEFDHYIDSKTTFSTWAEMQETAGSEWIEDQIAI